MRNPTPIERGFATIGAAVVRGDYRPRDRDNRALIVDVVRRGRQELFQLLVAPGREVRFVVGHVSPARRRALARPEPRLDQERVAPVAAPSAGPSP